MVDHISNAIKEFKDNKSLGIKQNWFTFLAEKTDFMRDLFEKFDKNYKEQKITFAPSYHVTIKDLRRKTAQAVAKIIESGLWKSAPRPRPSQTR